MLYSIVGTHTAIREKARSEMALLGEVSKYVYGEHAGEIEEHIDASSLFGEKIIITCVQLGDSAASKEILVALLEKMKDSSNIFIIDEPFADIHLSNKLSKMSVTFFNAKEEKIKDTSVFALCDSFAARDKKEAWRRFIVLREKGGGEAIAGALWWKFQLVWQGAREGRRSAFSVSECEKIGGDLVRSTILAHRGKRDLMVELEKIILSL